MLKKLIELISSLFSSSKKTEEKQQVETPNRREAVGVKPLPPPKTILSGQESWVYPGTDIYIADPDGGKRLLKTPGNRPEGIVIHHTATYNLNATVNYFKKNVVDVHFVMGHDGKTVQMVPCNKTAAHAGKSSWNGRTSLNNYYIGIEVVNIGWLTKKGDKYYDGYKREWKGKVRERSTHGHKYWEPFTEEQEKKLMDLCVWAAKAYGIPVKNIVAHYEVSPGRKNDPAGGLSTSMDHFRSEVEQKVYQR